MFPENAYFESNLLDGFIFNRLFYLPADSDFV